MWNCYGSKFAKELDVSPRILCLAQLDSKVVCHRIVRRHKKRRRTRLERFTARDARLMTLTSMLGSLEKAPARSAFGAAPSTNRQNGLLPHRSLLPLLRTTRQTHDAPHSSCEPSVSKEIAGNAAERVISGRMYASLSIATSCSFALALSLSSSILQSAVHISSFESCWCFGASSPSTGAARDMVLPSLVELPSAPSSGSLSESIDSDTSASSMKFAALWLLDIVPLLPVLAERSELRDSLCNRSLRSRKM